MIPDDLDQPASIPHQSRDQVVKRDAYDGPEGGKTCGRLGAFILVDLNFANPTTWVRCRFRGLFARRVGRNGLRPQSWCLTGRMMYCAAPLVKARRSSNHESSFHNDGTRSDQMRFQRCQPLRAFPLCIHDIYQTANCLSCLLKKSRNGTAKKEQNCVRAMYSRVVDY